MEEEYGLQSEQYVRQAYTELNPLTGLYYNRAFLKKADEIIATIQPNTHILVAMDIIHFRLFNKLYGRENGDKILIHVAEELKRMQYVYGGVAGYLGGDNFCIIMPDDEDNLKELEESILECMKDYNNAVYFYPVFGVYNIDDVTISAAVMYDHATMAITKATGTIANRICKYDSSMEQVIEDELNLLSEIQTGLEKEEFTFYAQPQCDISTGKIVGAETLVRWKHSEKGLVSPGLFIPVLEKNGLISELDKYTWKKVCQWLRSWIDRGYHPVPVSVNVSRMDIFSMDVPSYLKELTEIYNLSEKLLKVEITESAYAENDKDISKVVKELREYGFMVMMDDFGSGYSSLNMLNNVTVDVLKLDMRFLDIDEAEEKKGIGILESVVNMARLMGLPIIVEGVENQKQEKFLLQMGCRYTQGYYYYRPLSIDQFEELLSDERRLDYNGLRCRQVEAVRVRELLDGNMYSDEMVNNMLGATAFYDVYGNHIDITRVNEQYYELTGIEKQQADSDMDMRIGSHVRDDDKQKLLTIFEDAYDNPKKGAAGRIHYLRTDGQVLWVHMRVFFLNEKDGHRMYYGSLTDVTEKTEKSTDIRIEEVTDFTPKKLEHIEKYFGILPCGCAVGKVILNEENDPVNYQIIYANERMAELCGGSLEKFNQMREKIYSGNSEELMSKVYAAAFLGETAEYVAYNDLENKYLQITFFQYTYGYVGSMVKDITHTRMHDEAVDDVMSSYREIYSLDIQGNYYRMIYPDETSMLERGDYEEAINRHFGMGKILKYKEHEVRRFLSLDNIKEQLKKLDDIKLRYKRKSSDGTEEWCATTIKVVKREDGVPKSAMILINSIDDIIQKEEGERRRDMVKTLANMSEGFFVYKATEDEKILYANPRVFEIYGCETADEFMNLVGSSFKGMVHPDDLTRVKTEIDEQIQYSDDNMDYVRYRIRRKDGEIRWLDDWGHLVNGSSDGEKLFYVFISDVTDKITEPQKEKLLKRNERYK